MVLELIRRVRDKGLPVVLISHNMPHVFEIADRIHVARLGKRAAVLNPKKISMSDTVAVMTGAMPPEQIAAPNAWRMSACAMSHGPSTPDRRERGCARAAPTRAACASSTSAWCCRRSALHGSLPKADLARLTRPDARRRSALITARLERRPAASSASRVRGKVGQPSVPLALNPDGAFCHRHQDRPAQPATCCWSTSPARCASACAELRLSRRPASCCRRSAGTSSSCATACGPLGERAPQRRAGIGARRCRWAAGSGCWAFAGAVATCGTASTCGARGGRR